MKLIRSVGVCFLLMLLVPCVAYAQPVAGQPTPAQFIINTVMFFLMAFFVYFMLVLKPQGQKEEAHEKFLTALKKNDEVVTGGGVFGRVVNVRPEFVTVEVAPNVRLKLMPEQVFAPPARKNDSGSDEKESPKKKANSNSK